MLCHNLKVFSDIIAVLIGFFGKNETGKIVTSSLSKGADVRGVATALFPRWKSGRETCHFSRWQGNPTPHGLKIPAIYLKTGWRLVRTGSHAELFEM